MAFIWSDPFSGGEFFGSQHVTGEGLKRIAPWGCMLTGDTLPENTGFGWTFHGGQIHDVANGLIHLHDAAGTANTAAYYELLHSMANDSNLALRAVINRVASSNGGPYPGEYQPIIALADQSALAAYLHLNMSTVILKGTTSITKSYDPSVPHEIRWIKRGAEHEVYLDGSLLGTVTRSISNSSRVSFGHGSSAGSGESYWDWFHLDSSRLVEIDPSGAGIVQSSRISWAATEPAGTGATVETNLSLDGGVTYQGWQACTNGAAVPGITTGTDLSNARLKVWEHLYTTGPSIEPVLQSITIELSPDAGNIKFGEMHFTGSATMSAGSPVRIRTAGLPLIGQAFTQVSAVKIATGKLDLHGLATMRLAGLALRVPAGALVITKDDYFSKNQPAKGEKVANLIEVQTSPLQPQASQEVYKSNDPITLAAGETQTVTVTYNDKPVIEAVAALTEAGADISITATYYAWGAMITLHNAGTVAETCKLIVTGRPLKVVGKELVTAQDAQSILEYGVMKYTFPDNPLVQTRSMAKAIADKLIASYKDDRRDLSLDWRGSPALTLADVISVSEYQKGPIEQWGNFYVYKQELEYDGTLKSRLEGRKM